MYVIDLKLTYYISMIILSKATLDREIHNPLRKPY
jgi:hypothetical protein